MKPRDDVVGSGRWARWAAMGAGVADPRGRRPKRENTGTDGILVVVFVPDRMFRFDVDGSRNVSQGRQSWMGAVVCTVDGRWRYNDGLKWIGC